MSRGDADPALHAVALELELAWLDRVLDHRLEELAEKTWRPLTPPPDLLPGSALANLREERRLGAFDRLVLILACAPFLQPEVLDPLLLANDGIGRRFTEFGGRAPQEGGGVRPTRQTALFLLAGANLQVRLEAEAALSEIGPAMAAGVHFRAASEEGEEGPAVLEPESLLLSRLAGGALTATDLRRGAVTQQLSTPYAWHELVLEPAAHAEVEHILHWARHHTLIQRKWGLDHWLKPGYRALFYGPSGTGKTLTAALLGKVLEQPVMRVDLSRLVSKYVGETEKNLARVFEEASAGGVLFFDEADSLFGRRVEARTSADRSSNQEVGFLLQKIEDHEGLVILASNLRGAIDPAFSRRFQSIVYFALPSAAARRRLWRATFEGQGFHLHADVDLDQLADDHALSGAEILNVLGYVSVVAAGEGRAVGRADLLRGVKRELQKSGRPPTGGLSLVDNRES